MSWRLFFASRSWLTIVTGCVAIELSLAFWGGFTFQVHHGADFSEAVPVEVPAQIVPVMLLLYGVNSAHQGIERQAGRRLGVLQLIAVAGSGGIVAAAALIPANIHREVGTLHPLAAVSAFVGMYGVGLIAATLIDRRIAGIPAFVPVLAPLTLDPTRIPGSSWWSFVIPGDGSRALSPAAWVWFGLGVLLVTALANRAPLTRRRT